MMTSVFRVGLPGPAAGTVKIHLVRDCEPDFTRDLPRMDEVVVLSYTDGSTKVACGSNINLDEVVEVVMNGRGSFGDKVVQGRTIFTLVPREGTVLDGDKLVADLKLFVHLAQRQDPEVLRAEWEQRQERRTGRVQSLPRPVRKDTGTSRVTLADVKGADALQALNPAAEPKTVQPHQPHSPAVKVQVPGEKAGETIARLLKTEGGRNAVAAARIACGVLNGGEIPAAKLREVAEMAEMLA